MAAVLVNGPAPAWADIRPGPVRDLTTPVTDLYTGVSSLDGTVTVEGTRDGAKARIDATVLFAKDSAVLRPGARERIRQVAKEFARRGAGKVLVIGYTDDLGPADHGLRLSIRRAGAVAATLADQLPRRGYPMTAVGKGEQDPAVPNTSETNRRKNRRVVITLDRSNATGQDPKAGDPADEPKPTPEPTTVSAAPTLSTTPSATAAPTPTPVPETATPTTAPTPTASTAGRPSSTPDVTAPPAPTPAGADSGGGGPGLDPVLASNLFLVAILIAVAAVALYRRHRRPGDPGPTPAGRPDDPPTTPGDAEPAKSQDTAIPASRGEIERTDGPRPDDAAAAQNLFHSPATETAESNRRSASGRADLVFTTDARFEVASRHPNPRPGAIHGRDLDGDLSTWFSPTCDLPRLSLLGPVTVRAHGAPIARRRPFYTELLTFLALRPHGATPDQVADAFSLTHARVRNDIKVLRDWLGTNPRTGRRHLPDARDTTAGRARGLAVYQVEGLLVDLHLFQGLVKRAGATGPGALSDLDQALRLVQGRPFDQLRPHGWDWLHEGDRVDLHTEAAIQRAAERAEVLRDQAGGSAASQPASSRHPARPGRPAAAGGGRP